MKRLLFLGFISICIPFTVLAGNTASYRVSLTIPEEVEISKEKTATESTEGKKEEPDKTGPTAITEKTIRQDQEIILKTIVAK